MSQVEALMLVALGFLLALMLVFAFGRSVWTASNLYAKRRREKDMPAAMMQLQAECDKLRADNARISRKLEVGTENMSAKVVTQMAEVSRHRDRLMTMDEQAARADDELNKLAVENTDLHQQIKDLSREIDAQQLVIDQLRQEIVKQGAVKQMVAPVVNAPANENPGVGEAPLRREVSMLAETAVHRADAAVAEAGEPAISPAMARALAAEEKVGKPARFNFDRRSLSPSMERTMYPSRQAELKDVIEEARRSLAVDTLHAPEGKSATMADPVRGFAQRIREIQKKSDAHLNKNLK